ncbi:MAG TPA: hypothetical protein VFG59_15360 [Anaeromyxobacter sp.]|nr:hypothetical protein [Anaeromyxobacter sp.]
MKRAALASAVPAIARAKALANAGGVRRRRRGCPELLAAPGPWSRPGADRLWPEVLLGLARPEDLFHLNAGTKGPPREFVLNDLSVHGNHKSAYPPRCRWRRACWA